MYCNAYELTNPVVLEFRQDYSNIDIVNNRSSTNLNNRV